jgi:hypothetical protein
MARGKRKKDKAASSAAQSGATKEFAGIAYPVDGELYLGGQGYGGQDYDSQGFEALAEAVSDSRRASCHRAPRLRQRATHETPAVASMRLCPTAAGSL